MKAKADLNALNVPSEIHTDIMLPSTLASGLKITWTSSDTNVVSSTRTVNLLSEDTEITLTAEIGGLTHEFTSVVIPRNLEKRTY